MSRAITVSTKDPGLYPTPSAAAQCGASPAHPLISTSIRQFVLKADVSIFFGSFLHIGLVD